MMKVNTLKLTWSIQTIRQCSPIIGLLNIFFRVGANNNLIGILGAYGAIHLLASKDPPPSKFIGGQNRNSGYFSHV